MKNLQDYTLADPQVTSCPFGYYKAMRSEDPIHFDAKIKTYIVSRHEDILKALAQPLVFSSGLGFKAQSRQAYEDEIEEYYRSHGVPKLEHIVTSDPPYHTRIRSLMDKAFTAHRVASMESYINEVANELIDGFVNDGKVDFVERFALPFPLFIIADQLGIARSDFKSFRRWSDATVEPGGRQLSKERVWWCAEQTVEMWNYLKQITDARRASPQDDMISDLVHARTDDPDNPELSPMELFQVIRALLVAGNETTTTAIGNGMLILTRSAGLIQKLRAAQGDDKVFSRMTEEILRLESPVQGLPRVTTEDTVLGGVSIPKGSLVFLGYASANRDDEKFEAAEDFSLERKNVGHHLAFGSGIHRCIGAMLARMEIKVAMRQIIRRLDNISLAVPENELTYAPSMLVRALVSLPVTFTRRQP
jgi:cytochrome P450